jgi:hypothetical protein
MSSFGLLSSIAPAPDLDQPQSLDGNSTFTFPQSAFPPMNAPDTLFTIYNLNESQEHSLMVTNKVDYDSSDELVLYPFEIFGTSNE